MKLKLFVLILALIAIPLVLFNFPRVEKEVVQPILESAKNVTRKNELSKITADELLSKGGEYAVVVKNLKTDESYSYNEDRQFNSASLYKLWVMVTSFQKIKDGTLSENDVLSLPLSYLDERLSTETPTPTPEGTPEAIPTPAEEVKRISMRTDFAIEKMITISDNYAALLLASRSGTPTIVNFLDNYGLKNSNFRSPPQTTAEDIALFYEKLYKGELIDEAYSKKMMDILKEQTFNDRLPKYLPEGIEVAHKTGELFGNKHDAGIVYGKKGDYLIVVLSETNDPQEASENMANFSKRVFDYFEN